MIRMALTFVLMFALAIGAGCDDHKNTSSSPIVSKTALDHINDKTQIDPPNELGYSKISIRVGDEYKEGVLDAQKKEVIPPSVKYFVEGYTGNMALLQLERKFLFVPLAYGPYSDTDFVEVTGFQYATPYSCGVALVCLNDRWFYIKEDGTKVSEETFDWAEPFHHDRALVKKGEKYQIIKPDGHLVKVLEHEQAHVQSPWCGKLAISCTEKFMSGFVDLDGNAITDLIYENVSDYDPEVKRIRVYRTSALDLWTNMPSSSFL